MVTNLKKKYTECSSIEEPSFAADEVYGKLDKLLKDYPAISPNTSISHPIIFDDFSSVSSTESSSYSSDEYEFPITHRYPEPPLVRTRVE